jgi:hypothetical protein
VAFVVLATSAGLLAAYVAAAVMLVLVALGLVHLRRTA